MNPQADSTQADSTAGSTAGSTMRKEVKPLNSSQFATLFEESYQRLWVLAAAILGDRHQAEDVVQEAAIVAMTRLDKFTQGTSFLAWMSQIVRFQAFNWSRKRQRRQTHNTDPVTLDLQPGGDRPADPPLREDVTKMPEQSFFDDSLIQALGSIKETPRACLLLRTIHNLSYAEIAEMLEIAEGTAMSHVHRSRIQLRERLRGAACSPTTE